MEVTLQTPDGRQTIVGPVRALEIPDEDDETEVLVCWKEIVDALDAFESSDEIDIYHKSSIVEVVQ